MATRAPVGSAASTAPTRPARGAARAREFEWSSETAAALAAAFANDPAKLARITERIAETDASEARLQALRARKAALLHTNRTFRHKAGLPPVLEEEATEPALPVTVAPPPQPVPSPSSASPSPAQGPLATVVPPPPPPRCTSSTADSEFGECSLNPRTAAVPSNWGQRLSLYQYSGPNLKGVVSSVFADGLLYRIITERGDWAFYNDTRYYDMQVHYVFHASSQVTAGPRCLLTRSASAAWVAKMTVPPEQTLVLVSGTVVDFENKSQAVLLSRRSPSASAAATTALYTTQRAEQLAIQKAVSALPQSDAEVDAETDDDAEAVRVCVAQKLPFVDPTFFPDHTALCTEADAFFIPPLHWRRPRDYLPAEAAAEVRLFRDDTMHPRELVHGSLLPDSSFVSAVRALAETPALVRRLFRHPSCDPAIAAAEQALGVYRVQLCCGGLWGGLVVDDYVPSRAHCPEFAHVASDLRRIWLPLLEKAYAKACGSFSALLNSPAEQVAQDLSGAPAVALDALWPSASQTPARLEAFVDTFYRQTRGKVLLKPFSLATARTASMRERLEQSYHNLGLTPGIAVVVLGVEKCGTSTLVRLRQTRARSTHATTTTTGDGGDDDGDDNDDPDWLQVWLDGKKPWAPALADTLADRHETHTVYMETNDIAQYFQGGWAFYAVARFAELRLAGPCLFVKGCPSHCLAIDVTAPVTLMVTLTQVRPSDKLPRLSASQQPRRKSSAEELASSPSIGSLSAFGALDAIGLQVLASVEAARSKTLALAQCTGGNPDIFARAAADDAVTYGFATSLSIGVPLMPEMSPYFVLPRIQSATATTLYTVALFLAKPHGGSVSISSISASPFAKVLASTKVPPGVPSPSIPDVLSPVRAQYRWSSSDVISTADLSTLTWQ